MPKNYTDPDLDLYRNEEEDGASTEMTSSAPPAENDILKASNPPPPPKRGENPHIAGLMQTFGDLVTRSKNAKYARTAANMSGLAGVVAQMIGQFSSSDSNEANNATLVRGQDINFGEGQDKTRLGLVELAQKMNQDTATSRYHMGSLMNMAKQLGLEGEKLGFEKEKLTETSRLKERELDIEQNKVNALSENSGLMQMNRELGMLGRQRTAGLAKIISTQGVPKNETSWLRKLARNVPGLGNYVNETAPNAAMKSQGALDQMYQGAVSETLQRYGVTGGENQNKPYWETLLEEK